MGGRNSKLDKSILNLYTKLENEENPRNRYEIQRQLTRKIHKAGRKAEERKRRPDAILS